MSLGDLKRRISSIKSTNKITQAMSLISAAQSNQIKHLSKEYITYKELIEKITAELSYKSRSRFDRDLEEITLLNAVVLESTRGFVSSNDEDIGKRSNLLIVVTSEKGLCGAFNSAIVNQILNLVDDQSDVLCIGKKGYEMLLRKQKINILTNNYIKLDLKQVESNIVKCCITKPILNLIGLNKYSNVKIVYTKFISMLRQDVDVKQLFPLIIKHKPNPIDILAFDGNPLTMLQHIIPEYLHSIIYHCILNSFNSETVKRMMTMDSSSKNSQEMLDGLNLQYNRARQTKVTMELIEVISGMQ
jgi:F-type H+-transporting ATPase subunit gamma